MSDWAELPPALGSVLQRMAADLRDTTAELRAARAALHEAAARLGALERYLASNERQARSAGKPCNSKERDTLARVLESVSAVMGDDSWSAAYLLDEALLFSRAADEGIARPARALCAALRRDLGISLDSATGATTSAARRFGTFLRDHKGKCAGAFALEHVGKDGHTGAAMWRVTCAPAADC